MASPNLLALRKPCPPHRSHNGCHAGSLPSNKRFIDTADTQQLIFVTIQVFEHCFAKIV
jgi:hypothetical protein